MHPAPQNHNHRAQSRRRAALVAAPLLVASLIIPTASLISPTPAFAETDAVAVMQSIRREARIHKDLSAEVELTIANNNGESKTRRFRLLHKIFPDRVKSLIKFISPVSVRRTGLLSETIDAQSVTHQWLFLPALPPPRKLDVNDRNKSFVGSDFTNADVAGRRIDEDEHSLVSKNEHRAVVRSIPKNPDDPYGRIETTVLIQYNVPETIVFFDRNGDKIKTLKNTVIQRIKGMHTPVKAVMTNHKTGGSSTLEKRAVVVSEVISPHSVGLRGLQK